MIRLVLCALLVLSNSLTGEYLRVLSWNIYNYVVTDRLVEGVYRRNYPKPEFEKAAVREVLIAHDADVVMLQEIGPLPFLLSLRADLMRSGLHYPYYAHQCGFDEIRCLAILSRVPLSEIHQHKDLFVRVHGEELPSRRGALEVVLRVGEESWHLFNVHLKSRLTVDPADFQARQYRAAEATVLRDLVRRRPGVLDESFVLVAGDFNDHPRSPTIRRFLQVGDRPLMVDPGASDSQGHRWTYHHARNDRYERIDYMLMSPRLLERLHPDGVRISDETAQYTASDHRALVADFCMASREVP
ncbi:MAG: endonuclease/exonuclease/phosphatase family protein [Verrucomicrobia bacterium]|nr:endonuclease/exonuclease/phosphatase family protein [Verrucomicrobiota bacterium]